MISPPDVGYITWCISGG